MGGKPLPGLSQHIEAVRHFNRFYTREVGLLRKTFLDTPWTLGEMRVLYEIHTAPGILAKEICAKLGLDPAYLSRMISSFIKQGLLRREPSTDDARQLHLFLTDIGEARVEVTSKRQYEQTRQSLSHLSDEEQDTLTSAMRTIEQLLTKGRDA